MQNRFIVTPFFLDQPSPELASLSPADGHLNQPALSTEELRPRLSAVHRPLADLVAGAVAQGERPVSVAGDCCTAIGVLAGLQRGGLDPLLLWLDAHGDFNTWETTPSGFIGGMPLAMLVGRGEQTLAQAVALRPLPEAQVILSDGRDLDPGEKLALAGSAVRLVMDARRLPAHVAGNRPLYVHFDTDVVDPQDAPAMHYPTPGGPSFAELRAVFQALAQTGRICAVSMSTWTPELDADGRSQAVCMELLHALIEP